MIEPDDLALIAAVIAAICLLLISIRRRASMRTKPPSERARELTDRLRDDHHMKRDMESLLVEIQEMARGINAQFDTKFAKLDALLRDADERIAKLEQLTAQAGRPAIDVTVDDNGTRRETPAAEPSPDDNHNEIYSLADAGKTAVEIAKETGHNTGEIELILALRKRSQE